MCRCRRRADHADSCLDILCANFIYDIGRRQADFSGLGRVEPYAHRIVAATEDLRGVGETLAVIPGGEGDDAALALVGGKVEYRVQGPARFERTGALQVLRLQTEAGVRQTTEGG